MKKDLFPGDYEIFPGPSNVVSEIFQNKFDITWLQKYRDTESSQREWSLLAGENAEDDGSVKYKYNNEFFRCDNFSQDHDGMHIVFAGCSETEGQGGNIEDSWGHILFKQVKKTNSVDGFYNLGKSGFGWQKVISQTQLYIKKYGKPDLLFVLLPNVGRLIGWSNKRNSWTYKQQYPNIGREQFSDSPEKNENDEFAPTLQSPEEYKKTFMDFAFGWRLFEDFCSVSEIKLVWGSWEPIDNYNFDKLKIFNNFVSLSEAETDLPALVEKYRESMKLRSNDLEKRDGHHGRIFHEYWADSMFIEAKRKGFIQ
jgi:hypothetical protein